MKAFNLNLITKIIVLAFLCLFNREIDSQNYYTPIHSNGIIPDDFRHHLNQRINKRFTDSIRSAYPNYNKNTLNFILKSNYVADYYFRSGQVCFNNQLNAYLNSVLDYLLKDNMQLRSELSLYLLKSTEYNACCLSGGELFINIGLLSKVENEAQLAFVIAHEVMHYYRKHHIRASIEQEKADNNTDNYKKLKYDQKKVRLTNYSKFQELDADKSALKQLYLKTDYSLNELGELLQNMLYSYRHLGALDSITPMLNAIELDLPSKLLLNKISPVVSIENYNDSLSTHPNIKKRKENLDSLINKTKHTGDKKFIVSEQEFHNMQQMARVELSHLYLQNQSYEAAICNNRFLISSKNNTKFAEITTGQALMQLANYKIKDDFTYIHSTFTDIQGSPQRLYYLFEKTTETELAVLALIYNWELSKRYPENNHIVKYFEKTIELLVVKLNYTKATFLDTSHVDLTSFRRALTPILNDHYFLETVAHYEDVKLKALLAKDDLIHNKAMRQQIAKENSLIRKKGFALGIDSIVVVNPLARNRNKQSNAIAWRASEKMRSKLIEAFLQGAEKLNLHTTLLDIKYLNPTDIDKYNDYCRLSDWFSEKCSHYSEMYDMHNAIYASDMVKKYGTKYFAWSRLLNNTYLDVYLFDIETGQIILSQREHIGLIENRNNLNNAVNKILSQIKNRRN